MYFGIQPIFPKILNFFDHSMLSVAMFARITSLSSLFFCRRKVGGGDLMLGATKKETLLEICNFNFQVLVS